MGNPHLEDVVAEIRALEAPHAGEHVLYVTEPTSVAAERATGDPLGWGYEERGALRGYLATLVAGRPPRSVCGRIPASRRASTTTSSRRSERCRWRSAPGRTLDEDCAWADTVVGCETMAMAVALAAGRRVVSVVPEGGRFSLPFGRSSVCTLRAMAGEGEIQRLESLWSEDFGDSYVERNQAAAAGREPLWRWLYERHPFTSVLEVGCNVGGNLHWLQQLIAPEHVYGIDINAAALRQVRATMPDVNAVRSVARTLPFRDAQFELTFTTGVLIHQPPDSLPIVLSEIVRCSKPLRALRRVLLRAARGGRLPRRARRDVPARLGRALPEPVPRARARRPALRAAQRGRHGLGRRDVLGVRETALRPARARRSAAARRCGRRTATR